MVMKWQEMEKYKSQKELCDYLISNKHIKNRSELRSWITDNVPKESYFQKEILDYINNKINKPAYAWKSQAGLYQTKGVPDIIACIKGRFYAFEVKRPFVGKVSDIQKETIARMIGAGGHVYVVNYVSEVRDIILKDFGMIEEDILS